MIYGNSPKTQTCFLASLSCTVIAAATTFSDKQAMECLRQAGWSVEGGIEVFYSSGMQVVGAQEACRQLLLLLLLLQVTAAPGSIRNCSSMAATAAL